jgi:hypothetical protein
MWRIVMIIGCLSVGSPALAQNKATIEKLNELWTAAFNKGDAAAVAALYTEDAYSSAGLGNGRGARSDRGVLASSGAATE